MKRFLLFLLPAVALAAPLPDPKLTPGEALPVSLQELATPGRTHRERNVSAKINRQVLAEYGIAHAKKGKYQFDHLIPLELGGANTLKNIWPEPTTGEWNAHRKDQLENRLHRLVISGSLDLQTAQRAIAFNWIAAFKTYVETK